jgi:multiple sugar transport system substrate-binding protein
VRQAATAFAIFSVTAHWNDLFWPLIAVTDTDLATPPRCPSGGLRGGPSRHRHFLRDSVAGTAPDVAFVGLDRWRILEARGLTQPLDPFLPEDPGAAGYTDALLSLGQYQGTQDALATSACTLVMYVNPDLVERAGGSMEDSPTTFDGVIELAAKINALGDNVDGIWVDRHDWRFQSLLGSYGGRPMTADESDITFDDEARQAFPAGTLGIMMDSSSLLTRFKQAAGERFDVTIKPLPVAADDPSEVYFPTGGSAIVMLTDDPAKQAAAWEYISFVTGPEGQKIIVETTGYAPANALVIEDESYLGDFYERNPNAKVAHEQVARYAGPWYADAGPEGVAVTDLIAAALVDVTEGADPKTRIPDLATTLRDRLGMR